MNAANYRLVFNASRGCLMAVSEVAGSCAKSSSGTTKTQIRSSKRSSFAKTALFNASKEPLAQSIRARAAPNLGVFSAIPPQTGQSSNITFNPKNYSRFSTTEEVGTQIQTTGNVVLKAGQDVNARAATVNSAEGTTALKAGRDVNLTSGQSSVSMASATFATTKKTFSKSTKEQRSSTDSTSAQGSQIGGEQIIISAGRDITVKGSEVISDKATTLVAANNINIEAATNTSRSTSFSETKTKGLFSNGGLSVTIGKKQNSTDQKEQGTTAAASTVGSINGNVNLLAGQTYRQVGSDVLAPQGDINILAKDVQIIEARETTASQTETKSKQSGLTLALTNPVLSAGQSIQGLAKASGNTSSSRAKGLAAAGAGLTGYTAYNGLTDKAGNFDASKAADINVSISLGSSKSQSNSNSTSNTARGSTVAAGNNVNITATGAGQASNVLIQGSEVKAGNNLAVSADNQVNLLAAKNESSQQSTNSSSGGSIGLSLSAQGLSATASASKGKGKSDGQGTSYTNSRITAGNTASIKSGADTSIKGAVVAANQIKADIGGNLKIESLQDTNTYSASQKSSGFSLSVPITGGDFGASVSASKSKIDSNFQSVNEQSGLKAGDGGFQVSVANNTSLTGGVIASAQAAVDSKANTFTTGGNLTITDVQNTASFSGKASGFSIDVGAKGGGTGITGVGVGMGSDKGSAASTSSGGISGIAGNTAVRTGDAETGLKPIFNADKVQRNIDAQVAITTAFTKQVGPIAAKGIFSLLESMATPASVPTAANPTPAADKIIKSDQEVRAGFNAIQADPKLDAPAKVFFADLAKAYDANEHMQALVSEAKSDPQGYQQRVSPPSDSQVKDPAVGEAMRPVVFPLALGAAAPAGSAPVTAATSWSASVRDGALTYDPQSDTWRSATGSIPGAQFREFIEGGVSGLKAVFPKTAAFVEIFIAPAIDRVLATVKPGVPLPPQGPLTTPIATAPDANSTASPADQPKPVVTTSGSQIAPPLPGGNSTVSPVAGPMFNPLTMAVPPNLLGNDGKLLPGINGSGTPIPMPATSSPNQTAEDFAKNAFNGQTPSSFIKNIKEPGSWLATLPDGTTVLYRPAGQASRTESSTANVDINNESIKQLNRNLPAKFKFPKQ